MLRKALVRPSLGVSFAGGVSCLSSLLEVMYVV